MATAFGHGRCGRNGAGAHPPDADPRADAQHGTIIDLPTGVDDEAVIIDPTQVTTGVGFGHALDCAFPPSGAIEDCRPVVVTARIFR